MKWFSDHGSAKEWLEDGVAALVFAAFVLCVVFLFGIL